MGTQASLSLAPRWFPHCNPATRNIPQPPSYSPLGFGNFPNYAASAAGSSLPGYIALTPDPPPNPGRCPHRLPARG